MAIIHQPSKHAAELAEAQRQRPQQQVLPGSEAGQSERFLTAVRLTPCGARHLKLWFVFLASYCRVLAASRVGTCRVSVARLMRDSEGGRRQVLADNARLVDLGLLTVTRTGRSCAFELRTAGALGCVIPHLYIKGVRKGF